jgi:Predicted metal-binding protein related to the C-terminal domain of SecA
MKGSGRNGTCPCGSGQKAKRCCGIRRGPSPAELAKAFLAEERRTAGSVLCGMDREEFDELFEEMVDLPTLDVSLQADLPRLLSPELECLRVAIDKDDDDAFEAALAPALRQLDTPQRRAALARAVLSLRDAGRIDAHVAAVAIIDLGTRRSALFQSSAVQGLAVSVGAARTPSGLLVASR